MVDDDSARESAGNADHRVRGTRRRLQLSRANGPGYVCMGDFHSMPAPDKSILACSARRIHFRVLFISLRPTLRRPPAPGFDISGANSALPGCPMVQRNNCLLEGGHPDWIAISSTIAMWLRWILGDVAAPIDIGGVTVFKIPRPALMRYRLISWLDAERQADAELFEGLLAAAAKYVADGGNPILLTPFVAERLGLLPPPWLPGPIWSPKWLSGTKFDITLDIGGRAYRGVWLGYVDRTFLGIGIKGTYDGLKPIIDRYRTDAYRIYFPYPHKVAEGSQKGDRGLLLIFFDAAGLQRAIASTKAAPDNPSARLSPPAP